MKTEKKILPKGKTLHCNTQTTSSASFYDLTKDVEFTIDMYSEDFLNIVISNGCSRISIWCTSYEVVD